MKRKLYTALGALAVLGVVAGAALAFYGGSGSGATIATAGTSPLGVVVDVTITPQAGDPEPELYPGDVSDVEVTISGEPGWPATRRARIGSVSATVDSGSLPAGCQASWFSFSPPSGALPAFVTGSTPLVLTGGTLTFTDEEAAQDACSGATLTLNVSASPTP
jgi:hypothetical protein